MTKISASDRVLYVHCTVCRILVVHNSGKTFLVGGGGRGRHKLVMFGQHLFGEGVHTIFRCGCNLSWREGGGSQLFKCGHKLFEGRGAGIHLFSVVTTLLRGDDLNFLKCGHKLFEGGGGHSFFFKEEYIRFSGRTQYLF